MKSKLNPKGVAASSPLYRHFGIVVLAALTACSSLPPATPSDSARADVAASPEVNAKRANTKPERKRRAGSNEDSEARALVTPPDLVLYFPPGGAQFPDRSLDDLKGIAEQLSSDRGQDVQLTALSNSMGSHSLCLALSAERLNGIVSRLLRLGVRYDQLRQRNLGCENVKLAQAACAAPGCIDPNERVELRLIR